MRSGRATRTGDACPRSCASRIACFPSGAACVPQRVREVDGDAMDPQGHASKRRVHGASSRLARPSRARCERVATVIARALRADRTVLGKLGGPGDRDALAQRTRKTAPAVAIRQCVAGRCLPRGQRAGDLHPDAGRRSGAMRRGRQPEENALVRRTCHERARCEEPLDADCADIRPCVPPREVVAVVVAPIFAHGWLSAEERELRESIVASPRATQGTPTHARRRRASRTALEKDASMRRRRLSMRLRGRIARFEEGA